MGVEAWSLLWNISRRAVGYMFLQEQVILVQDFQEKLIDGEAL